MAVFVHTFAAMNILEKILEVCNNSDWLFDSLSDYISNNGTSYPLLTFQLPAETGYDSLYLTEQQFIFVNNAWVKVSLPFLVELNKKP